MANKCFDTVDRYERNISNNDEFDKEFTEWNRSLLYSGG